MAALALSGKDSKTKTFRTKWFTYSWQEIVRSHQLPTRAAGVSWCTKGDQDPVSPALGTILELLSDLHGKGLAYRSINGYRSMLSGTLGQLCFITM